MDLIIIRFVLEEEKVIGETCSVNNEIRLNRAVALLPKRLREYVYLHELSHTIHHNHSLRFWRLVERNYPEWRTARKELKGYSWILMVGGVI